MSVSVVIPAYNHERFIAPALYSALGQDIPDLEVIIVDDGSTDATGRLADAFAARPQARVVHQANAGAHAAINRGFSLARGDYIAILNSDDRYAPGRLRALIEAMEDRGSDFAFSLVRFIDDDGVELDRSNPYVEYLRAAIGRATAQGNPLQSLLLTNIAISSGNFVFHRSLLEKTGGMRDLRVCHDWDFILTASYYTPITFVREPLYDYRVHQANTVSGMRHFAQAEADLVLDRFFERIEEHPVLRDSGSRRRFLDAIKRRGHAFMLPPTLRSAT